MKDRVAVFTDNGYISKIVPNGTKIDFMKFCDPACGDRERLRTYFYDCMPYQSEPPTNEDKKRYANYCRFRDSVEKQPGFQMRFGKLSKKSDGSFEQKRVDILLAVERVRLSLGSSDRPCNSCYRRHSDFVPAVEAAKDAGVITSLYYSKKSIHDGLLQAVDERYVIDEDLLNSIKRK